LCIQCTDFWSGGDISVGIFDGGDCEELFEAEEQAAEAREQQQDIQEQIELLSVEYNQRKEEKVEEYEALIQEYAKEIADMEEYYENEINEAKKGIEGETEEYQDTIQEVERIHDANEVRRAERDRGVRTNTMTIHLPDGPCAGADVIEVKYPTSEHDGPWPIVSWMHGFTEGALDYTEYTDAIAAAGYFTLIYNGCSITLDEKDIVKAQTEVVDYVFDNIDDHRFKGKACTTCKVGLAGHDVGGYASIVNSEAHVDWEVGAILANSPISLESKNYESVTNNVPAFFTVGTEDLPELRDFAPESVHKWLNDMRGPSLFAEGEGLTHYDVDDYAELVPPFFGCFLHENDADCNELFGDDWCDTSISLDLAQCHKTLLILSGTSQQRVMEGIHQLSTCS